MLRQQGKVVRTEGDLAWVRVGKQTGCAACDAGRGCGAGLFAGLLNRRPAELRVGNPIGAVPGTAVQVGIPERAFLVLVWRVYGLPLLAGLAGGWLAHALAQAGGAGPAGLDMAALAGGLAAGFAAWRWRRAGLGRLVRKLDLELISCG